MNGECYVCAVKGDAQQQDEKYKVVVKATFKLLQVLSTCAMPVPKW